MNAIILSVGDELTSGLTVNTNAAWLAQQLMEIGIETAAHITVGDKQGVIEFAIREAIRRAQLILISGGLGPTEDDVTREALAAALGEELVRDETALAQLRQWFASKGRPMSASNERQAMRPASAICLENSAGTAPGLRAVVGDQLIFVMPGVPKEMKVMFARAILPELKQRAGEQITLVTKINTFGHGESVVGEKIRDLMLRGSIPGVGTTVHDGIVSVRIYAAGTRSVAEELTRKTAAVIRQRLGPIIFGEGDDTLELAVGKLLAEKKQTVATAESCTGGMIAEMLTNISGSSTYVDRAWVTYANAAKVEEIGVPAELIAKHGAVSEEVCKLMAEGARRHARTDWAISTTGIAGPGGGSDEKPVGLVWIGLAGENETATRRFIFPGDRFGIRQRAAQMGLALLRWKMMGAGGVI
jgi:nicotinamide-nucleotide amidase